MRNVALVAILSCMVFGQVSEGQVPSDLEVHRYDIGIVEAGEVVPDDKGDVIVVIGAKWCGPCMRMYPHWKILRLEGYRVVYIDWNNPTWDEDKPEDEEIVRKFNDMKDKSVPDVYVYNTVRDEVVKEWHQYVTRKQVREHAWKPSSSQDSVLDRLR